ncbi:hypothetical protein BDK51DRAFT_48143 [Blyttiomyces helicus]|uniref:Uncharacterized protein n=1 Tax=Blyttiomyces helicus TaxID=388810 RepID=A0A4P9WJV4_9FUNG|nr:hypothetical protein BDK51DRAFT_48143 [Blyttiomyces helicus]|eukprot:RKO92355.1 hypothetical protein BDK51DRAFT_48143 [Blyttiomyces helicus]
MPVPSSTVGTEWPQQPKLLVKYPDGHITEKISQEGSCLAVHTHHSTDRMDGDHSEVEPLAWTGSSTQFYGGGESCRSSATRVSGQHLLEDISEICTAASPGIRKSLHRLSILYPDRTFVIMVTKGVLQQRPLGAQQGDGKPGHQVAGPWLHRRLFSGLLQGIVHHWTSEEAKASKVAEDVNCAKAVNIAEEAEQAEVAKSAQRAKLAEATKAKIMVDSDGTAYSPTRKDTEKEPATSKDIKNTPPALDQLKTMQLELEHFESEEELPVDVQTDMVMDSTCIIKVNSSADGNSERLHDMGDNHGRNKIVFVLEEAMPGLKPAVTTNKATPNNKYGLMLGPALFTWSWRQIFDLAITPMLDTRAIDAEMILVILMYNDILELRSTYVCSNLQAAWLEAVNAGACQAFECKLKPRLRTRTQDHLALGVEASTVKPGRVCSLSAPEASVSESAQKESGTTASVSKQLGASKPLTAAAAASSRALASKRFVVLATSGTCNVAPKPSWDFLQVYLQAFLSGQGTIQSSKLPKLPLASPTQTVRESPRALRGQAGCEHPTTGSKKPRVPVLDKAPDLESQGIKEGLEDKDSRPLFLTSNRDKASLVEDGKKEEDKEEEQSDSTSSGVVRSF